MAKKMERRLLKLFSWFGLKEIGFKNSSKTLTEKERDQRNQMKIIKKGSAMRVIFFYPGEEGTYVDHADVTLYENGIVHIKSSQEETTTHLQNCEILWRFETDAEERVNKVRLLKPKTESRGEETSHKVEKASKKTEINPETLE
jgi:hypothetical protein